MMRIPLVQFSQLNLQEMKLLWSMWDYSRTIGSFSCQTLTFWKMQFYLILTVLKLREWYRRKLFLYRMVQRKNTLETIDCFVFNSIFYGSPYTKAFFACTCFQSGIKKSLYFFNPTSYIYIIYIWTQKSEQELYNFKLDKFLFLKNVLNFRPHTTDFLKVSLTLR